MNGQTKSKWITFVTWNDLSKTEGGTAVPVDEIHRIAEYVNGESIVILKDGTIIYTRLTLNQLMAKIRETGEETER